jgi:aminocyclitol acetyltransferase
MYWAIEHVIKKYARNREITVLGKGQCLSGSIQTERLTRNFDSFKEMLESIDRANHYVVLCENNCTGYDIKLSDRGYAEIEDYYDWAKYVRTNGHLPVDVEYNGTKIGYGSYFSFSKDQLKHILSIGRFCSISATATIKGNHSMNRITTSSLYPMLTRSAKYVVENAVTDKDPRGTKRRLTIGNDVWIGANVFINASKVAQIGDGAIIGANSVVVADVPPYAIVYGIPAKVRRYRFSQEQTDMLMCVKWWEWNSERLSKNIELLMDPELFFAEFSKESAK